MRKFISMVALLVAGNAFAVNVGVGGFGGVSMPISDMADDFKMSPKFGGKVMVIDFLLPKLSVELAVAYHLNHPPKNFTLAGVDEPKTTVLVFTTGVNYTLVNPVGPWFVYTGGGGGFYREEIGLFGPGPPAWADQATANSGGR